MQRRTVPETHIAPLFPALQAVAIKMGAPPHDAGRWTGLVTSALAVPIAIWALLPLVGRRWALVAGALILVHPRLLVTAERIQPEALAATCLLLFAGCWAREWRLGVAVAAAGAYLTRPEGFFLMPSLWAVVWRTDSRAWRRWLGATAFALLLAAPYLIYLRRTTGEWTLTGKVEWAYSLGRAESAIGNRPIDRIDLDASEYRVGTPLEHLIAEPREAIGDYLRRLGYALGYLGKALSWPLFAVSLVGLWLAARSAPRAAGWWPPLALIFVIPVAVVHYRHVLPYLPLLLASAVCAVAWSWDRFARRPAASG